ncbi:DUF2004 domain-containing protein [Paucibacter sp. XJ19-41]|uniref:DUF2004 domain-containing protein n=1 Tax=Paucibacter sp. XJ19-41 TaxID=2927824 RepID=UPI00234BBCDF|nr:DUF2004 domain-containing protein [Paucibacter sp. XJ19-41]MDC6170467.1 DUF2004 domain-containing protein [Paucibacter sp. XJ19-41]
MSIIQERTVLALEAIKSAFGTEAGADSVDLFVEHHLEELPNSYWVEHLSSGNPRPSEVLGLLVLRDSWGEGDAEHFDFTLQGDSTDYVLSVHFDEAGQIDGIAMES